MVQTEVSMMLASDNRDPEVLAWIDFASTKRQTQFLPSTAALRKEHPGPTMNETLERLAALGHRALAVDLTLPGDPMHSTRVLVRGLCAMAGRIDTPRFARLCTAKSHPSFPEPF
jgi:hypothetical protein